MMRGMCGVVGLAMVLWTTIPGPVEAQLGSFGCCLRFVESNAVDDNGQPFVSFTECSVTTAMQCDGQYTPMTVDLQFEPGKICGPHKDECVFPALPGIVTLTTVAFDPDDCGTDQAFAALELPPGTPITLCTTVCNDTGGTLNNFTLSIGNQVEFENTSVILPNKQCSTVRKELSSDSLSEFPVRAFYSGGGFVQIDGDWCASSESLPQGSCSGGGDGGGGGDPDPEVYTDSQSAYVRILSRPAPVLGAWALTAVALLLGAGGTLLVMKRRRNA